MQGRRERKYRFFHLSLYDYQSKSKQIQEGVNIREKQGHHKSKTYNRFTKTKQKTQHKIKGNYQTTK